MGTKVLYMKKKKKQIHTTQILTIFNTLLKAKENKSVFYILWNDPRVGDVFKGNGSSFHSLGVTEKVRYISSVIEEPSDTVDPWSEEISKVDVD